MVTIPDWRDIEETLFTQGKAAISRFAREHPDVICSFFAFAWMPFEGDFSICFDTWNNTLRAAKEHEQYIISQRNQMLGQDWSWKSAEYFSTADRIVEYAPALISLPTRHMRMYGSMGGPSSWRVSGIHRAKKGRAII